MKKFTDITILLDRSGSMSLIKEAMEQALATFVKEHQVVQTTKLTLIQFDDMAKNDLMFQSVPISSVEPIKITPRGNTPLLDAMCLAIDSLGSRYKNTAESDRPDQVLFIVITDGQENASTLYKRKDVFDRVRKQSDAYNWKFVYLGANQDTFAESQSLGFGWGQTLTYSPNKQHIGAMGSSLASSTTVYTTRSGDTITFSDRDRLKSATIQDRATDPDIIPTNSGGTQ